MLVQTGICIVREEKSSEDKLQHSHCIYGTLYFFCLSANLPVSFFMLVLYQKRMKKEKRSRRRFQEQLEQEVKKRAQYEEALRTTSADTIRLLNGKLLFHYSSTADMGVKKEYIYA